MANQVRGLQDEGISAAHLGKSHRYIHTCMLKTGFYSPNGLDDRCVVALDHSVYPPLGQSALLVILVVYVYGQSSFSPYLPR